MLGGRGSLWHLVCGASLLACGADEEPDPRARCYPEVHFADPRLEIQVRARVRAFEGPLTVDLLERWSSPPEWSLISHHELYALQALEGIQCLPLTHFSCIDCELDDLSPLRAAPLTSFRCTNCSLGDADLSPLASSSTLEEIIITASELRDVDDLLGGRAAMPSLTHVDLSHNQIREIHGTPSLPALRELRITNNLLEAAPPVAGMPALTRLYLDDNPLSDLTPLAGHGNLSELSIIRGAVTSVAALADLATLTWLDLRENQVEDIGPLPTGIYYLWLSNNQIRRGVEKVSAMPNLRALSLSHNHVPTLAGVEAPLLEQLGLEDNAITSVAGLRIPQIRWLTLDRNPLPTLAGLDAPAIEQLSAVECQLSSLEGLAGLPALEELDVAGNKISGLGGLAGLAGRDLLFVDLSRNPLGGLTGMPATKINTLAVEDGGLTSLEGIEGMTLRSLRAAGNAISDLSPLVEVELFGEDGIIDLSGSPLSDISPLASIAKDDLNYVFAGAAITDLSQLLTLKAGSVDLRANGIVDASVLASGNLEIDTLILADNAIASLPPIWKPIGVSTLDLSGNALTELTNEFNLPDTLDLSRNQLTDLSGLAGKSAGSLDLSDNAITSLAGLAGLGFGSWRRSLNLANNSLATLDGIEDLVFYGDNTYLQLSGNQLTDASALGALVGEFREIDLGENALVTLPAMPGVRVERLVLSGNPLSAAGAVEAGAIECIGCAFSSAAGIADALAATVVLDLSKNPLSALDDLAGAPALQRLVLEEIATADLAPLAPLLARDGFELDASGNGIVDVAPFASIAGSADLSNNAIVDLSPLLEGSSGVFILVGNPLDIDLSLRALIVGCLAADRELAWGAEDRTRSCWKPDDSGS
ncbi:MAG: hypothetical protein KC420_10325 [Myxococcales bacterium]|nr:hypothetical protein [Myxococcales bacterium]